MITAFPLCWPPGRSRVRWPESSNFRVTLGQAIKDVQREVQTDAHRRLAMRHHPDRGGDGERMADINAARDQGLAQL